jgi:hypothetical protein
MQPLHGSPSLPLRTLDADKLNLEANHIVAEFQSLGEPTMIDIVVDDPATQVP